MEALGRVELPTNGLGNRCSIHLSYRAARRNRLDYFSLPQPTDANGSPLVPNRCNNDASRVIHKLWSRYSPEQYLRKNAPVADFSPRQGARFQTCHRLRALSKHANKLSKIAYSGAL